MLGYLLWAFVLSEGVLASPGAALGEPLHAGGAGDSLQWHFGMKLHIGVDADTGLVHSMSATAANVHDVTEAHNLLHGGETMVWCDAGYQGVHKRAENRELKVD